MAKRKMHAEEYEIDPSLAARLVAEHFPAWAELPVRPVPSSGTDHALFRIGEAWVMRLPRLPWTGVQIEKEARWLPRLAPLLPLPVPVPVASCSPSSEFPQPWSVYRWIEGAPADVQPPDDGEQAAVELARFVRTLHGIDPEGGPPPGAHNSFRGVPLAERDEATRRAIASLSSSYDAAALTGVWDEALSAPRWEGAPLWIHGDLLPGNLLVEGGRLGAVIDFGCLGVGDPACDCLPAWSLFTGRSREIFRAELGADDALWERGRGWALSIAVIALPYYEKTNPALAGVARRMIEEILAERQGESGRSPEPLSM